MEAVPRTRSAPRDVPAHPPFRGARVQLLALGRGTPDDLALLDAAELRRASRFHFARDRQRFIAARAGLRKLLGAQLGLPPEELRFLYGPHGKPELHPDHGPPLAFNLSHSGDWALIAIAEAGSVGVDLELVRPLPDLESLGATCFSPGERARVLRAPPPGRPRLFFRLWTLKEAWLKARGTGLDGDLTRLESVESGPGQARMCRWPGGRLEPERLSSWEPGPGLMAALALGGDP